MQKRYKKLIEDTSLFAISSFGSKILTILLVPLYTSVLVSDEFGVADVITTTANVLYPIFSLSIYEASLRYALDKSKNRKTVFSISMIVSLSGIAFMLVLSPLMINTKYIFGQYWWEFIGVFATITLYMCISNYIKGCGFTKVFAIQGVVFTLFYLILNIYSLVIEKAGLSGYFVSMIIAYSVSILYMLLHTGCYKDFEFKKFDKSVLKEMLRFSIPLIPTSVAWMINASADKYMILAFIGVGANGLYGIAHKIPSIFTTFSSLFSQAWRLSAISNYDETDRDSYYKKVYNHFSLVCIYFCFALILCSWIVAKILFKKEYFQAWIYIPPLVIAAFFAALCSFLYSLYAAAKKTKILSITSFIGAAVNIIFNLIFIRFIGALGASIATMISYAVVWLITLRALKSFIPNMHETTNRIISLVLLIVCGLYYSFQGKYFYLIGPVMMLSTIMLNVRDTKELILFSKRVLIGIKNSSWRLRKNG